MHFILGFAAGVLGLQIGAVIAINRPWQISFYKRLAIGYVAGFIVITLPLCVLIGSF